VGKTQNVNLGGIRWALRVLLINKTGY